MITPLVNEKAWLPVLLGLPVFDPGDGPVTVISPHPDDETLATGGLIASLRRRGAQVSIIAVTDGENAYGPRNEGLRETRQREQAAAARELGVDANDMVRLGLVDSGVAEQREELLDLLTRHLAGCRHVLAPWSGDFHPDHEACGWAAHEAASRLGIRLSWYFFWTWHRGSPSSLAEMRLQAFPLDDALLFTKFKALEQHRSQLQHHSGEPILPEYLLAPARRNFEVFAAS